VSLPTVKLVKLVVYNLNIDSDFLRALTTAIRKHFTEKPAYFDPRKYMVPARDTIKEIVMYKLYILGCAWKLQKDKYYITAVPTFV